MKTSLKSKPALAPVQPPDFISLFFILLYLLVDFVPRFDSFDIIGPQWLYIGIVDLAVAGYFLIRKKDRDTDQFFTSIFLQAPVIAYVVFFLLAGVSVLFAVNAVEFLVCFTRLAITVITFFNVVLLLRRTGRQFMFFAQVIAVIALLKSLQSISIFFNDVPQYGVDTAILNMKGDVGNKNIFASSLVVKIPFLLYCIYTGKSNQRFVNLIFLCVVVYTILLANARAAYVAILLQLIGFIAFALLHAYYQKTIKRGMMQVGYVIIPIILAIIFSTVTISAENNLYGSASYYGTVTDRFNTISIQGSSGRNEIWKAGFQLFQNKPLTGVGYGNWKIASIPYDKHSDKDVVLSLHAHNDFLEMLGELGIIGGLSYLLLFVLIFIPAVLLLYNKKIAAEKKGIILVAALSLGGYFVDAMLNFPMERTTMQLYFALSFALFSTAYSELRPAKSNIILNGFTTKHLIVAILLLLPAIHICNLTYKSMVVQAATFNDFSLEVPENKWQDVNEKFPSIPNLTQTGVPIDAIKGRYLMMDKKYDEAMPLFDKAIKANPYLMYPDFLKGLAYYQQQKMDSAYRYSKYVFKNRPNSYSYFSLLASVSIAKSDSIGLRNAFHKFIQLQQTPEPWNLYLFALTQFKYPPTYLLNIADSAYRLFPGDSNVIKNKKAVDQMIAGNKTASVNNANTTSPSTSKNTKADDIIAANVAMQEGLKLYANKDFKKALVFFKNATSLNPGYYPSIENTGMCYYLLADYASALKYFKQVVASGLSADGKSEFFAGICLINTGNKEAGCNSFRKAADKKYFDAQRLIDLNCK